MDPSIFHAAVAQAMNADRPDLYWGIDKALRLCVTRALARVDEMDPSSDADVADALETTRETLRLFAVRSGHGDHGTNLWPSAGRPPRPPRAPVTEADDEQAIAALTDCATALQVARGPARKAAAEALQARLALARRLLEAPRRELAAA
ncbi:MAG TPA: hypothetical protein VK052_01000 [Zeimonas sp.]|nr:hypothetical protein [Zeimonas sp.]